jgi:hypothetical protein
VIRLRRPIVIVKGESLIIAMTLDEDPKEERTLRLREAVEDYIKGLKVAIPEDPIDAAIFFSLVYGGSLLLYLGRKLIPISRYLPQFKVSLSPCTDLNKEVIKDKDVLSLWETLVSGDESSFLKRISSLCLEYPKGYRVVPGESEISPVGIIQEI